jgi:diguanylate cyclase (GGDEF)-like protein
VVLDLVLPDQDGRELLRWTREQPGTAHLPVVVLSARRATSVKRTCIDLAVDHYLEKPADFDLLSSAIGAALKRGATFEREARKDLLTGLRNRAGLRESVAELQNLASRADLPLCVGLLDIDHFKRINDDYGHGMGDGVLAGFGELLERRLRLSDVAGRWGGEEIVVVLPNTTPSGATIALRKLADALREMTFSFDGTELTGVTFSAGVALFDDTMELDDAIDEADRLMYAAKRAGRGRVLGPLDATSGAGPHILLAEDDADTARMIGRCSWRRRSR